MDECVHRLDLGLKSNSNDAALPFAWVTLKIQSCTGWEVLIFKIWIFHKPFLPSCEMLTSWHKEECIPLFNKLFVSTSITRALNHNYRFCLLLNSLLRMHFLYTWWSESICRIWIFDAQLLHASLSEDLKVMRVRLDIFF